MNYKSQYNQDKFVNENFFHNKKNGVFVDIGAHDGVSFSNSYFFEKSLGWSGICVEPIPHLFKELEKNRNCIKVQGCVWKDNGVKKFRIIEGYPEMLSGIVDCYDSKHISRIEDECKKTNSKYDDVDMICYKLNDLLSNNNIFNIDLMTIDTEGSEYEIIKSIDFEKFNIECILIENNYFSDSIREFLKNRNYYFHTKLGIDDLYIKNKI